MAQSILDYGAPVAFATLEALVNTNEAVMEGALVESEAQSNKVMDLDLYDWLEVDNMDEVPGEGDTDVSEDDGEESTLRSSTDAADG